LRAKLKASTERMEIFSGRLERRKRATRGCGSDFSWYYSIFFLARRLQKPMSIITFQVTRLPAFIISYYCSCSRVYYG
jgi:hypothetical protein